MTSAAPARTATRISRAGPVPFAFEFDRAGRLVLSDASGTANTFAVGGDGSLYAIGSGAPDGRAATCWIVQARRFFFTTSKGSDTITRYAEEDAGSCGCSPPTA